VNRSGIRATLSAFWSLGASGLAAMEPAFALAGYGRCPALLAGAFGLSLAPFASDSASQRQEVVLEM
jgi:hypothetical protein